MSRQKSRSRPEPQGPSQRQLRVSEVIRRALSEILARGERWSIDRLVAIVRQGPPGSVVENVSIEDTEADGSLPYPFSVFK